MSEKKELSQSFKERFASELREKKEIEKRRKEGKIRLEDMSDEEHLWYTIRKQWREEKSEQEVKIPHQNHVDINKRDTLEVKNPTLKVFDY